MGVLLAQSELPSAEMLAAYHAYEYVAYCTTLVFVVITITVILTTSQGVSQYRWYLLHGLIWSLLFDTMGTLIGAVVLFPLPCYFGVNAASNIAGHTQAVYFFVGVATLVGKIFALIFQFEYRYYQAQSSSSKYRVMCSYVSGNMELALRAGILVFMIILILLPFALFFPDQDEQRAQLAYLDPVVAQVIKEHPDLLCFSTGTDATKVIIIPFFFCRPPALCGVSGHICDLYLNQKTTLYR
ncbi:unnamed protein product [Bursaphelenchus xylophilus]|uniref:(pine wood nematode) hypothetical protein n=1 Tax=Bursaphelenchus xylophilus TaxID=6326 RepID=A0A1I7S7T3_BURXY|nr:unnamed protein product [Bursaphelenchus xylophilus]CAG9086986.1 unnamed protein product [Bursaphelenchus xylophilus]